LSRNVPLLPDRSGESPTKHAGDESGFELEVDRLANWVRVHGLDGGGLVGYSLGARIALGLLVRHPSLFTTALLIGVHPGLSSAAQRAERERLDRERAEALRSHPLAHFVASWESMVLFHSQSELPEHTLAAQRAIRLSHDGSELARSLERCGLAQMPDYRSHLANVWHPVELITGERDAKFSELAVEMQQRLPSATVHVEPHCGHNVALERPALIAQRIAEMLA
jgi:2-succinyl-6-hydroxy-2,4-cyclohexadiene-1-carboxylate synthase